MPGMSLFFCRPGAFDLVTQELLVFSNSQIKLYLLLAGTVFHGHQSNEAIEMIKIMESLHVADFNKERFCGKRSDSGLEAPLP
jgi:hypothetical protein